MKQPTVRLTGLQHRQIEEQSSTRLQAFQRKIYLKAKQNPDYKFYCLYDKVFRKDTLAEAYKRVKANKGAAGIDGITFKTLEGQEQQFLDTIERELKARAYHPSRSREVPIPKKNGKTRILRIPTIKDRVVQMALKLIIEPIFETDFQPGSYGYRPKKSAHDALIEINMQLFPDVYRREAKRKDIHSIDLQNCFDTIPHTALMTKIARRIIDRQVLHLIKLFLNAGILREEGNDDNQRGTPQGGVLSPLLANVYLDAIDRFWKEKELKSPLLRYADDIVVLLHKSEEWHYQELLRFLESDLKLTVNREKTTTSIVRQGFDYLGFTIKQKTSRKKKEYLAMEPSRDSLTRIRQKVRDIVRHDTPVATEIIMDKLNAVLRGWQQYFDNVTMGTTRNHVRHFTELRVMRFLSRRIKKKNICLSLFRHRELYEKYGLYELKNLGRMFSTKVQG